MKIKYLRPEIQTIQDSKGHLFRCSLLVYKKEFENENTCILNKDIFDFEKKVTVYRESYISKNKTKIEAFESPYMIAKAGTIANIISKDIDDFTKQVTYIVEYNYNKFVVNEKDIKIIKKVKKFNLLD